MAKFCLQSKPQQGGQQNTQDGVGQTQLKKKLNGEQGPLLYEDKNGAGHEGPEEELINDNNIWEPHRPFMLMTTQNIYFKSHHWQVVTHKTVL